MARLSPYSSQKSKFNHVVASLSPDYATEVRDLLLKPPADSPYTTLKEQLTKRTSLLEQRGLQQLFTGEELGDRKPTQLLVECNSYLVTVLKELFLQKLPHSVRMVLASTPEGTTLSALAEMADKIIEVAAPTASVAAVSTCLPDALPTPLAPELATAADIADLRSEISQLEKLVRVSLDLVHLARPIVLQHLLLLHRVRTRPITLSAGSYHLKFGERARAYCSPCSWTLKEQAGR